MRVRDRAKVRVIARVRGRAKAKELNCENMQWFFFEYVTIHSLWLPHSLRIYIYMNLSLPGRLNDSAAYHLMVAVIFMYFLIKIIMRTAIIIISQQHSCHFINGFIRNREVNKKPNVWQQKPTNYDARETTR